MNLEILQKLYKLPLLKLLAKSSRIHPPGEMQLCSLISIKTGGCSEDCRYCAQSARYQTPTKASAMLSVETVVSEAKKAVSRGARRICLGAAWREVRDNRPFEEVQRMVKEIAALGVEVCCTLGMLNDSQAQKLKESGLYAYNHNLDTSEEYYPKIITTRTYQERLETVQRVKKAGLSLCCGAIFGMGETVDDRLKLLAKLAELKPDSVPINVLHPIPGTPLQHQPPLPFWELLRLISLARLALPKAKIRLSSGREKLTIEQQTLCFIAGANSLFMGEKLLTVANTPLEQDQDMFNLLGIRALT